MKNGVYVGKGFDLQYHVSKDNVGVWIAMCLHNGHKHELKDDKAIKNFLSNHKLRHDFVWKN